MKIMMLGNQGRSMAGFWRVLINAMIERGGEVICCVPPGDEASEARLKGFGARIVNYNLDRKGLNPLNDARTFFDLKRILGAEKPDFLFATTIKPVIYGCYAAWLAGVPNIFATITGLGYAFEEDNVFKKVINRIGRILYRASLCHAQGIFFQNRDDSKLFVAQGILPESAPVLYAAGTGVDTEHFAEMSLPAVEDGITFLLVGRLLEAKGIEDYAKAAAMLKQKWPQARFQLLGPPEAGPGSLDLARIRKWSEIEYLGETDDVRPYLGQAHIVVLPSWREGLPTSLMEAISAGRPLVATDVAGCREVVFEGINGFLANAKDPASLAGAMERFLIHPELIPEFGKAGRAIAVADFDARVVSENILAAMGLGGKS